MKHVVLSPGSRNTPLIVAISREKKLKKYVIVDERSAAFVAVGIAQQSNKPVAIVCTSGSAVLNYAPAIAEAKYQHLPIIAISADRQTEWIDQNDSQTIQQTNVLGDLVKRSIDIPAYYEHSDTKRWIYNQLNDALQTALNGCRGPVHINVRIKEPLNEQTEKIIAAPIIEHIIPNWKFADNQIIKLANSINAYDKIMIVITQMQPSATLNKAVNKLAELPQVAVLTESISNIYGENLVSCIDRTITSYGEELSEDYSPELLVTFGGAPVSRMIKRFLRKHPRTEEWRIGMDSNIIDTMQHLTCRIETEPESFLQQIMPYIQPNTKASYRDKWLALSATGKRSHNEIIENAEWTAMSAFANIFPTIPNNYRLQLSNGTTIRYAQLFDTYKVARCDCNRGVSGIDGSSSTALGASLASDAPTLLITGDMSFSYDLNAITTQYNHKNFKLIVMENGGGGIFRFIPSTDSLPELEQYCEVKRKFPIKRTAEAFGFTCFEAANITELKERLANLYACDTPAMLIVHTDAETDTKLLKRYMSRNYKKG